MRRAFQGFAGAAVAAASMLIATAAGAQTAAADEASDVALPKRYPPSSVRLYASANSRATVS